MLESYGIESLITPSTLIETKHMNNNDWVITVILRSYKNFLEVKQVEDYLTRVLMIGDNLQCKHTQKENIYLLKAEVFNIKIASCSVVLKIDEIKSIKNTRSHQRYDVYLSSSFCIDGSIGENYCVVVNVSNSGMSIITRSEININDNINISVYFPHLDFVTMKCSVKWFDKVNSNNMYGLHIIDMDEISQYQYYHFIKKLQRKEWLLRKKGEKMI